MKSEHSNIAILKHYVNKSFFSPKLITQSCHMQTPAEKIVVVLTLFPCSHKAYRNMGLLKEDIIFDCLFEIWSYCTILHILWYIT